VGTKAEGGKKRRNSTQAGHIAGVIVLSPVQRGATSFRKKTAKLCWLSAYVAAILNLNSLPVSRLGT
jgi:hypothetical protein